MRTEDEKIRVCTEFLERRGFTVLRRTKYISASQLAEILGVCKQTVCNWGYIGSNSYRPDFPVPVSINRGRQSWVLQEVQDWQKSQESESARQNSFKERQRLAAHLRNSKDSA